MDPAQEESLIQKARVNPRHFQALYRMYFPRVYAYVAARLHATADVEDVVSEVFLKALKNIGQFSGNSFAAWLFSIARNAVYDFFRRNGRSSVEELTDSYHSDEPLPEAVVLQAEIHAQVLSLIRTLSPRRREIVGLKFFAGLQNREIAQVLGIDERSVASHLSRALRDLHARYLAERQMTDG